MVYTNLNRIQFGNGDVSVMLSMAGTRKAPQAMLVFQNREPTKIGRIEEDADLSRTNAGVFNPSKDFAMLFSKPESIACVVSALLAIKKATFGDNNLAQFYLEDETDADKAICAIRMRSARTWLAAHGYSETIRL